MTQPTNSAPGIPVSLIVAGRNPRSKFDPVYMEQLQASIRENGVLQPILIRPMAEGKFQIVAGERRYRALVAAFGSGDEVTIPALVKEMSDEDADRAALIENVERQNMTPVEEAESAARVLGHCGGDREDAARRLGWTRGVLDRRLALMYAIPEVREALQADKLLLGHAELLAVLRKESQAVALDMLLKSATLPPVSAFKDQLDRMVLSLDAAIFDKSACLSCHHNTGNQQALFAESLSGGNCTNKSCYDGKTEAHLQAVATELRGDYQVVRIVRPGENYTIVPIHASGARGVGEEQAQKCRSCKDFGAAISGLPDKLGHVFKDQCSNTACNVKMIAANMAAIAAAEKAANAPSGAIEGNSAAAAPATAAGAQVPAAGASAPATSTTKATTAPGAAKAPATSDAKPSVKPSAAFIEYRNSVWRHLYKREVLRADARTNRAILLALCLHQPRQFDTTALSQATKALFQGSSSTFKLEDMLTACLDLESEHLGAALQQIAASASGTLEINDIEKLLRALEVNLGDHWRLNDEFLGKLTKNEIDAVCAELGIKAAMSGNFAKAAGGKKDAFIAAVLAVEGFDYKGKVPAHMNWATA